MGLLVALSILKGAGTMEEDPWGIALASLGVAAVLFLMFNEEYYMGRGSYWEKYAARYGLNRLLELYKVGRNNQLFYMIFSLLTSFMIIVFMDKPELVSGPRFFLAGLVVLAGGCLWSIRPVPMERRPRSDYRKEAAKLVAGYDKDVLALLDKLDGDVRRGESILRSRGFFFYSFIFPSAIVAGEKCFFVRPRIIPTGRVAYMSYFRFSDCFYRVFLFDEHKSKLGKVLICKTKDVEVFMAELNKRFGVQRTFEIENVFKKRRTFAAIVIVVMAVLLILASWRIAPGRRLIR
jgi:hypothetical protein